MATEGKLLKRQRGAKRRRAAQRREKGAYIRTELTIPSGKIVIVQKSISGRYGKKDQKRVRENPTRESARRWQDKRAEQECLLLLEENFKPGDYFMRFSYPPKTYEKSSEEIRDDWNKFKRRLSRIYKKAGFEFKSLYSIGRGQRGSIHFHAVMNGEISSADIERAWQKTVGTKECPYPSCNTRHLDASGYWPKLAAYIIKNGLETFRSDDPILKSRYGATRNLRRPTKKTTIVIAHDWAEKPKPKAGYWVDYETMREGFGEAGFPFQSYCQVRIDIDRPMERKTPKKGRRKRKRISGGTGPGEKEKPKEG